MVRTRLFPPTHIRKETLTKFLTTNVNVNVNAIVVLNANVLRLDEDRR